MITRVEIEKGKPFVQATVRDITELKQAQALVRERETRYRSLFENMLDGFAYCRMIFDEQNHPVDFIYLAVNDRFEKLTGLKEVVGKKVTEIIPGIRESTPELFDIYARVATTGVSEKFEIILSHCRSGSPSPFTAPKKDFLSPHLTTSPNLSWRRKK